MADTKEITTHLQNFDFARLFNQLGWQNPTDRNAREFKVEDLTFTRKQVAQLSGVVVFEITSTDGTIPDLKTRRKIHSAVTKLVHENVLIFVDEHKSQSVWLWVKNEKGKAERREHDYFKGQPIDLMLSKLVRINFDLTDYDEEGNPPPIVEVARRLKASLDVEKVTKRFYGEFQSEHLEFLEHIEGINDERDRRWYASVILNRLMFIYFLQKKFFVDGDEDYLANKLNTSKTKGKDLYFEDFLKPLFFVGFAKPDSDPEKRKLNPILGDVPFLNGGLFLPHKVEINPDYEIRIKDDAFENILKLFGKYSWNLDDTPGGKPDEINPDVLGYIFEKYINQKAFGAYYTRPEITQYLCERTIYQLILDRVKETKEFDSMAELLLNLDVGLCKRLWFEVLPSLSILDPACGSGAFLVAALKTLLNVYSALIGKMETLGDKELKEELEKIQREHVSVNYDIKKRIITNNLYGVDIMEEATEIAKLRLFMTLVSSVHKKSELEPLPNIDFNILAGNSLIGILKVDEKGFDAFAEDEQMTLGFDDSAKTYKQILDDKNKSIAEYRNHALNRSDDESGTQDDRLLMLREHIEKVRVESYANLNQLLLGIFKDLKVKFEQATWDAAKKKVGKPLKRELAIGDIEALHPFHWGYEFDRIMSRGGFDVIITNPPWETLQPNAKEFFAEYSLDIFKKKMDVKDFENELVKLISDTKIREAWLSYRSGFAHQREYFRFSEQYGNQVPIIDGKRHGKDVNLYKLFLETCFHLLNKDGECGLVIPGGIYSDLGAKKLREMLFNQTQITGLFGFENRKEIFEGVHRSFKFVVLSFRKGAKTNEFPARFMRLSVNELDEFPDESAINMRVETIKQLSPDSLSMMEFASDFDVRIAEKTLTFPLLGQHLDNNWNAEFHREFNMTDDANLFSKENRRGSLPLYEGKMIHQFNANFAEPRFWIDETIGRQAILGKVPDAGQELGYEKYRLAYRAIARNTDSRTIICTILPPCFTGNSLNVCESLSATVLAYCTAVLNSFVADWLIRKMVSANLNMFYLYQLPVPRIPESDAMFTGIIERATALICTSPEFENLAIEIGSKRSTVRPIEEPERLKFRAELDASIAHLYGLSEEEFAYVLKSFPLVSETIKVETLNAYRDYSRGLIK